MDGVLYELDGRKEGPVPHGSTSSATLLQDACAVVKQFMDRDPGELRQARCMMLLFTKSVDPAVFLLGLFVVVFGC